jgi:hypothetical protein
MTSGNIIAFPPDRQKRVVVLLGDRQDDLRDLARERQRVAGYLCRYAGQQCFCDKVFLRDGVVMAALSSGRVVPAVEVDRVMR